MSGQQNKAETSGGFAARDLLAFSAILASFLIIIILIFKSTCDPDGKGCSENATKILNTLLPVLGTWVGTILAFYFSRDNFESASKNTQALIDRIGEDRLKTIKAKDVCISRSQISAFIIEDGKAEKDIVVSALRVFLDSKKISRIPLFNAVDQVKYVLHQSILYKFFVETAKGDPKIDDARTLQTMLDTADIKPYLTMMSFVGPDATLADAKAAMEGTPGSQDVFITGDGRASGKVMGWLTNVDIARASKA